MKKLTLIIIFIFIFGGIQKTNADNYPIGSNSAGMGNATVAYGNFWSIYHNQAGITSFTKPAFGGHYQNEFMVKELALSAGAFIYPTKSGVFALSYSHFGYSKYYESKVGLAFAKQLSDIFSVGIQLNYLSTYIEGEYGSIGIATAEIGLLAEPIEDFFLGVHVFNPASYEFTVTNENIVPTIFRLGTGYHFDEKLFIGAEVEKDLENEPFFKAGVEYEPVKNFYLRAGVGTQPVKNSFGLGYKYKKIQADIAFARHYELGYTPHFSLIFSF